MLFKTINQRWGEFIATHPRRHIAISLCVAALLIVRLKDIRIEHDIRTSFSPPNSNSAYEYAVYREFFNLSIYPDRSFMLFSAKDGGSMLRLGPLRDVLEMDRRFMDVLRVPDSRTGWRNCDPQCDINLPFHMIAKELIRIYEREKNATVAADSLLAHRENGSAPIQSNSSLAMVGNDTKEEDSAPRLLLDYPISTFHGHRIFIGMNLVGAQISNHLFPNNNSRVVSAHTLILWYFARADTAELKQRLQEASLAFFRAQHQADYLPHVRFELFGDEIANREMATVLMSIGFGLLLLFIAVTVQSKMRGVPAHRIALVILTTVACPLAASMSAFGLLIWLGNPIYTIMCVTPFLIAGVGVDNAFIILQSWTQNAHVGDCRRRLGVVFIHVGPSVAITSLTNTVAFGIGYATPTPQMSLFCLCTSLSVFFNYILTFTLLTATVVAITPASVNGRRRVPSMPKEQRKALIDCCEADGDRRTPAVVAINGRGPQAPHGGDSAAAQTAANDAETNGGGCNSKRISSGGAVATTNAKCLTMRPSSNAVANATATPPPQWIFRYAEFLHSRVGRTLGVVTLLALHMAATGGVARMRSTFEPSKAFPSDSPLASSMNGIRTVFNEFFPLNIFVNAPPNISDAAERQRFYAMVEELEAIPESYGANRTLLWLRNYEEFDRRTTAFWDFLLPERNYTPGFENLDFFLRQINYPPAIKTTALESGVRRLDAFQFTIIARNMSEWLNRAVAENKCREILARYPEFNATIYDGDAPVLNLLLTARLDLIGSIIVTIACMIIICSFFIAHQIGVMIIALTIMSICYILVGMISWWGADLDPVTIVDVLLATGFSVDYTAHVAHQFYAKPGHSTQRLAAALHEMFLPTLEASTSTALCMLPLFFVPTYAILAFAKTIFVVVAVGLTHGLFFMPIMMCWAPYERPAGVLSMFGFCVKSRQEKGSKIKLEVTKQQQRLANELHQPLTTAAAETDDCARPFSSLHDSERESAAAAVAEPQSAV